MKRITIILLALCLLLNGAALAEGGKGPEEADGGAAAEIPLEEPGPSDGAAADLPEPPDPDPVETPEPTPGPQALVVVEPPRVEGALVYGQPLSRVALAGGAVTVDGVEAEGMWAFIYPEEMPEPGVRDAAVRFVPVKKGWPAPETSVRVTVRKAAPDITLPRTSGIVYGQPLSSCVLSGGAARNPNTAGLPDVVGVFSWENRDFVPGVGDQSCRAVFTPFGNDEDLYYPVYFTVTVKVDRRPVTVEIKPVFDGTLGYSGSVGSLNVSGGTVKDYSGREVAGTWAPEDPDLRPRVGLSEVIVVFTPQDTIHYRTVRTPVSLEVVPSRPVLSLDRMTLPAGTDIETHTPTGTAVNAAGETVEGVFSFDSDGPVALGSGEYAVEFIPSDRNLYEPAAGVCTVSGVLREVAVEASWSGVYGQSLSRGVTTFTALGADGETVKGDLRFRDPNRPPAFNEGTAEAVFTPAEAGYAAAKVAVRLDIEPRRVTVTPVDEMNVFYLGETEGSLYYTLSEEVAVLGSLSRAEGTGEGRYPVEMGTLVSAEEGIELYLAPGHVVSVEPYPGTYRIALSPEAPEDGWYHEAPLMLPPEGFEISLTGEAGSFADQLPAPEGEGCTVYLRKTGGPHAGAVTAGQAVEYRFMPGSDEDPAPDGSEKDALERLKDSEGFRNADRVALSPDGRTAAAFTDGILTVTDVVRGEVPYTGAAETKDRFYFGEDGKLYLDTGRFDPASSTFEKYDGAGE